MTIGAAPSQAALRRLASLNRQLERAVRREWEDDVAILKAEIETIVDGTWRRPVRKKKEGADGVPVR